MFVVSILINKNNFPLKMYLPTSLKERNCPCYFSCPKHANLWDRQISKSFGDKCTFVVV